jgi:cysteine-rich repeat protein
MFFRLSFSAILVCCVLKVISVAYAQDPPTALNVCGDGRVSLGEVCDDGNVIGGDGCRYDCQKIEICGDGTQDIGEDCDDGNLVDGDGCGPTCTPSFCGNGVLDPGEECDNSDDRCFGCRNFSCENGDPNCVRATCGNGVLEAREQCDDGNLINSDDCVGCRVATCGDGLLKDYNKNGQFEPGDEQCDDGNTISNDGCSASCAPDINTMPRKKNPIKVPIIGGPLRTLAFSGALFGAIGAVLVFVVASGFTGEPGGS